MDKGRWSQVWFGLTCVLVVGYGAVVGMYANRTYLYKDGERRQYQREITQLRQLLSDAAPLEYSNKVRIVRTGTPSMKVTVAPIIKRLKPKVDESILAEIDEAIMLYSKLYNIPPVFVVYLMKRESNFSPRAFSSVGAVGLMQVFPKWHRDKMDEMGITHEEVYDIDNNVRLGCWILRNYIDQTGSIDKALTKYVGGKHPQYVKDILVGYANEMMFMQGG